MNKRKAKQIFFHYNGQHYHMAHDGVWEEYKNFNIDKSTEDEWIKELINLRFEDFKKSSAIKYLIPLVDYYNEYKLLDELLSLKLKGTFIDKFVTIELLATLLTKNRNKIINYKEKKNIIINIISQLFEKNIPKKYESYNIENRLQKMKKKLRIK